MDYRCRTPYGINKLKSRRQEKKEREKKYIKKKKKGARKREKEISKSVGSRANARPRYESSTVLSAFPLKGWRRASVRLGISPDRGTTPSKPL